jgi:ion channel
MSILGVLAGLFILAAVGIDAFEAMLLPRSIRRPVRFIRYFFKLTWGAWASIGKRLQPGRTKDGFLSLYGPVSMIGLLICWTFGLILGYGLVQWGIHQSEVKPPTLLSALYFSGATFFTVGYGDVLPLSHLAKVVAVVEAGTGLAFLAVTIGYLPVLYQLFSRREAHVILLDARAGSPPSATALICRHGEHDAMDELSGLFREWEKWCAELIESHLSYPMLSYYRSQHDNQSWLAAITAVMDACAILLTGLKGVKTFSARMTFPVARLAIVELCRVFTVRMLMSEPDRLPPEKFEDLTSWLASAGLHFSDEETAEQRLAALRATYEPFLNALSRHFLLTLPGWLPEDTPDNWNRSSRGKSAKKLVETAPVQPL